MWTWSPVGHLGLPDHFHRYARDFEPPAVRCKGGKTLRLGQCKASPISQGKPNLFGRPSQEYRTLCEIRCEVDDLKQVQESSLGEIRDELLRRDAPIVKLRDDLRVVDCGKVTPSARQQGVSNMRCAGLVK